MDNALNALAEPRRRAILFLIRDREMRVGEIAAQFDVTRPAISQHLRVLKDAALVVERREGAKRLYRARVEGMREIHEYLESFWVESLDALKLAAEREEKRQRE